MNKDKILFWIDIELTHFGIAKSLKENYDCDLFAIFDTNPSIQKFFKSQKFVTFSKTWFYRDHILDVNKIPDMDYLISIEQKYGIDLNQVIFGERYFYNFNKYYNFTQTEILNIIEKECKLFEEILDEINPDFLIIKVTDYHQNYLLHEICKSRKIKILTYGRTRIGYRAMISENFDKIDESYEDHLFLSQNSNQRTFQELRSYIRGYSQQQIKFKQETQTSKFQLIKAAINFLVFKCNNEYRKYFANYGRTRFKVIYHESKNIFTRKHLEGFLTKNTIKTISEKINFIYFPLHLEPESVLSISAPYYTDQIEVIRNIARSIPIDYILYVKDHPLSHTVGFRTKNFYQEILKLPNVQLVHSSVSNDELIQKCMMVVTIAGTGGMEAAFYGKPSIILADVIYSDLPSVTLLDSIENFPKAIFLGLEKKVNINDLNNYVNYVEKNSFEFDYFKLQTDIGRMFYYGGFLMDVEISQEKMKQFLNDQNDVFLKLALEHIKKIKKIKTIKN